MGLGPVGEAATHPAPDLGVSIRCIPDPCPEAGVGDRRLHLAAQLQHVGHGLPAQLQRLPPPSRIAPGGVQDHTQPMFQRGTGPA